MSKVQKAKQPAAAIDWPRQILLGGVVLALSLLWLYLSRSAAPTDGIDVSKVLNQGIAKASKSWEHGALAEALLELENPELSAFSLNPWPGGLIPRVEDPVLIKALNHTRGLIWTWKEDRDLLFDGQGSSTDPAALGIAAILLGFVDARFSGAAKRQVDYLLSGATRFVINDTHTAISHRDDPPQLWGDFAYMVPPFFAYWTAFSGETTYIEEAVLQLRLYDDILRTSTTLPDGTTCDGLWRHIISQPPDLPPEVCCHDPDIWLTSNAWTVAGITHVLAALQKWRPPINSTINRAEYIKFVTTSTASLTAIINRMLTCLTTSPRDDTTHLLLNYLDGSSHTSHRYAFGDAAGTALIASAVYRLVVLMPESFSGKGYVTWADQSYRAVAACVGEDGIVKPVASVDGVPSKKPAENGTSEAQSMVLLMVAARRDCVKRGMCMPLMHENNKDRKTEL